MSVLQTNIVSLLKYMLYAFQQDMISIYHNQSAAGSVVFTVCMIMQQVGISDFL